MHLPTYFVLMGSAVVYGIVRSFHLWATNKLLFAVSVIVVLITLVGGLLQSANADDFEFQWMRWYVAPLGLLALSLLVGNMEIQDAGLAQAGVTPQSHSIPGESIDYANAAYGHFASMLFPIVAALFAKLVQFCIVQFAQEK